LRVTFGPGREVSALIGVYLLSRVLSVVGIAFARTQAGLGWARAFSPWDGGFYQSIIAYGYPPFVPEAGHVELARAAFFPLFPMVVGGLTAVLGTPVVATAVVLNLVLGVLSVLFVHAAARGELPAPVAYRSSLLFVALPGGVVFTLVQSDPLLVAACAAGLLALQRRWWVTAGLLGVIATATRPNGFGLVAAAAAASWLAVRRERDWRSLWAVVLSPMGAIAYWVWLWVHTGVPDAWFVIQERFWHQRMDFGINFLYVLKHPDLLINDRTYLVKELGFILLVLAAVAWYRGARMSMVPTVYTLTLVAQMVLFGGVGPRPRFLLVAFPLNWVVVQRVRDRWLWVFGVAMLVAQPVLAWWYSAQLAIP
jgi:hypothetical protein